MGRLAGARLCGPENGLPFIAGIRARAIHIRHQLRSRDGLSHNRNKYYDWRETVTSTYY
ncbi:MAG: hypothetical protein J5I98_24215 [Phaeodactylibacter sp.]|nr:hypothetical protein [Phaeodactylibacter sp.]